MIYFTCLLTNALATAFNFYYFAAYKFKDYGKQKKPKERYRLVNVDGAQ